VRKAIIERFGTVYRDKQEGLDHIYFLQKEEMPIHGLEVVRLSKYKADTSMYKTIWFTTQENVYELARNFIKEQMVGVWNYVEFK
jgi:hypothetical protein